jgi:hypothetical protein
MTTLTRGRRNPEPCPPLQRMPFAQVAGAIERAINAQRDSFDSIPAPHATTHSFGNSDELPEFGSEFLLLTDEPLLPNARTFQVDGATIDFTDGGTGGVYLVFVKSNGIGNTQLRDSAARSVIGRSAATAGDPADIAAGADGDVLQRAGGILVFAPSPVTPSTVTTPAQITSNQNNYALATAEIVRLSTDAARDMTGIVAASDGTQRLLVNVGANDLTLKHQNAGSSAANRFFCQGAADIILNASLAADIFYDATSAFWRAFPR